MISLIWAMDENSLIGDGNDLPWHIPAELQYFKKTTMGHPIAMGRKTFESLGRPLPGRENIIITRNRNYSAEGCTVFYSIEQFIKYAKDYDGEIFIIGGAQIYEQLLADADRLYLTKINASFSGDTYFPNFNLDDWQLVSKKEIVKDETNEYNYEHLVYERLR